MHLVTNRHFNFIILRRYKCVSIFFFAEILLFNFLSIRHQTSEIEKITKKMTKEKNIRFKLQRRLIKI